MADTKTKKCKHELCSCTVTGGGDYCSTLCEDYKKQGTLGLACGCGHPGCTGESLRT